ncbi:MAG TPA: S8 family serine peptidase [Thermoplasmata archaeon]|nr:S8 family serine peptidase [Thermoplasmata archaeon]
MAFLAWPAPLGGDPPGAHGRPEAGPGETFRTNAPTSDLLAVGAVVLEDYASFRIAVGTEAARSALVARGFRADPLPDASTLRFLAGPVVARDLGRSGFPWTRDANGLAAGIVHVRAPLTDASRIEWQRRGVEILRYVPANGFLVRGAPEAIAGLGATPQVDGAGPYAAPWKVRPGTPTQGIVDARVVVLPGATPDRIAGWLAAHGVPTGATTNGPGPGIVGTFGSGDFRWVRARMPAGLLGVLAELPEVEFVDPVRAPKAWNADTAWVLQTNRLAVNTSRDLRYWWHGLDGTGQVVAFSDTGLDYDGDAFTHTAAQATIGDLYNVTDPARRKVVRYVNMGVLTEQVDWPGGSLPWDQWSIKDSRHVSASCAFGHGTAVASTLAGNDNGIGPSPNDGNALGAALYVQDIGTVVPGSPCALDELAYLPENYADLFGPAGLVYDDPVAPVRIHSNSWGTDTNEYDVQARMVDAFVWAHPDLTILFASGNAGSAERTVGTPGTSKNILTVGGAGNPDAGGAGGPDDVALQSSRGPTTDGRIKPTIMAIFDGDSAMSDGDPLSGTGLPDEHWGGTSYSTPAAAAAAAIVRQYFMDGWYPTASSVAGNARDPSAALVRATLIASAVQMTGSGTSRPGMDTWPNNEQGFGRILLANVLPIGAAGDTFRAQVVDDRAGLVTGETATFTFRTAGPRTVKFVLAWSDYPGTVETTKALVNDLDLEVTAPGGAVYHGNVFGTFAQGQSVPGGTVDATNVEEAVILKTPTAGEWTVRVIGSNVPVGPQPFALVATGDLDASYGRASMDRRTYAPGNSIRIEVEDGDASAVAVTVRSDFEPAGEGVTLARTAPGEVWRGSIDVGFGAAGPDGVLQVRHGDAILLEYADPSPAHTATARARVDGVAPTVWDVRADPPSTASVRVRWQTDEPATSGVRYGPSPANVSSSTEDADLRTSHELLVTGLQADTLYYFDVVSRDRQGRETRDANGGRHYRARTDTFGDALLVIGDDSHPPEREAMWANALDAYGWTWSPWRVAQLGLPTLGLLQVHRAVAWQVGLEEYPPFDAAARALVKAYVDGGGRLFVSSHDTTWSFTDTTSQFYSIAADTWARGVLKADLACDPSRVTLLRGAAGDPISGSYTTGLAYAAHRDGGAVDGISVLSIGGAATAVWTDDQVTPTSCRGDPVALRWIASGPNGTAGTGVWGGTPSRLVYFAFEITGLDATAADPRPTSPTRALVIDNALRWLLSAAGGSLDRDHPEVTVTSPSGGTITGGTATVTWTATSGSESIAGFDLEYSPDGGQTWSPITSVPGTARTYAWSLAGLANGDAYLVRIVARDAGSPSLRSRDESDASFSIRRAGGDTLGPVLWAGSVRLSPNPPGAGTVTQVNGTADDRMSGGSDIDAAEYFVGAAEPNPTQDGTGTPLDAADGAFDEPLEDLVWSDALALAPGTYCAWVHARDADGTWGPYEATCFDVVTAGPDATPPSKARPSAARLVNGNADLEITWQRAPDDSLFGGATSYRVLRSTSPGSAGTPVSGSISATGAATYTFTDAGAGTDPSDLFYRVESTDDAGFSSVSDDLAAKIRVPIGTGTNLLGMPVGASDRSVGAIAAGAPWASAWTYDGCTGTTAWSSAVPSDAASFEVPLGRGVWLNATAAGSVVLVGVVPATARIDLCAGWNLVGLPGFATGITVAAVKAATGADLLVGIDPATPYGTRALGDAEALVPGRGVWIRVPADVTWSVPTS